jgi:hypothetical protein
MYKPCMFSYLEALWQMSAAERAENHFNGIEPSSSGVRATHSTDARDKFFALDSGARFRHS